MAPTTIDFVEGQSRSKQVTEIEAIGTPAGWVKFEELIATADVKQARKRTFSEVIAVEQAASVFVFPSGEARTATIDGVITSLEIVHERGPHLR